MSRLELAPLTLREAHAFVARVHRHHKPSRGGRFAIGVSRDGEIVGVAVVGRPVARRSQDGWTVPTARGHAPAGAENTMGGSMNRLLYWLGYWLEIRRADEDDSGMWI